MKFSPSHIIYHDSCADGFTAAWVGYRYMADVEKTVVETIPVHHGSWDGVRSLGLKQNRLLFVDICPPRDILIELSNQTNNILVLDHHKTAMADCGDLIYTKFDMDKSGAMLSWRHFWKEVDAPRLVKYVQDHDLWLFDLAESDNIRSYIRSFDMSFNSWDILNRQLQRSASKCARYGEVLLRAENAEIELMTKDARIENIAGYDVPIVNAHNNFSKLAKRLYEIYNTPFAAVYFDRGDGLRQWSLRSREDFDVSEIAKIFNGGGHARASGFETKSPGAIDKKVIE